MWNKCSMEFLSREAAMPRKQGAATPIRAGTLIELPHRIEYPQIVSDRGPGGCGSGQTL